MRQVSKFLIIITALFLTGCASTGSYKYSRSASDTPYSKGSDAYYQSNFEEAVKYFEQHIAENPDDDVLLDMTLYNLAGSYKELGNKSKAIETYQKLIDKFKEGYWVDSAKEEISSLKK